jgi:hypothetical protein
MTRDRKNNVTNTAKGTVGSDREMGKRSSEAVGREGPASSFRTRRRLEELDEEQIGQAGPQDREEGIEEPLHGMPQGPSDRLGAGPPLALAMALHANVFPIAIRMAIPAQNLDAAEDASLFLLGPRFGSR